MSPMVDEIRALRDQQRASELRQNRINIGVLVTSVLALVVAVISIAIR